jgi:hypothetical protein
MSASDRSVRGCGRQDRTRSLILWSSARRCQIAAVSIGVLVDHRVDVGVEAVEGCRLAVDLQGR